MRAKRPLSQAERELAARKLLLLLSHACVRARVALCTSSSRTFTVRRKSFLDAMETVKEHEAELLTQLDGVDRSLSKEDLNFGALAACTLARSRRIRRTLPLTITPFIHTHA